MATAGAARPAPASSISPASALSALPGVGPALIGLLALLGISRPADLLLHLPLRF
jgi:predicted flap endonuclease-1-like 5' DNA nuclease